MMEADWWRYTTVIKAIGVQSTVSPDVCELLPIKKKRKTATDLKNLLQLNIPKTFQGFGNVAICVKEKSLSLQLCSMFYAPIISCSSLWRTRHVSMDQKGKLIKTQCLH